MDLYSQPEYSLGEEGMDLDREWKRTLDDLRRVSVGDEIKVIAKELDVLDGKINKTKEEELRQVELLERIVANITLSQASEEDEKANEWLEHKFGLIKVKESTNFF